jgi:hypothetical protein
MQRYFTQLSFRTVYYSSHGCKEINTHTNNNNNKAF